MENFQLGELIPGLPEELGLECVSRLSYTTHRVAAGVCRRWRQLLQGRDFYEHRKVNGFTHKVACLVQSQPSPLITVSGEKAPAAPSSYGIAVFNPVTGAWDRLVPVPKYPSGLPLFCQLAGCGGRLVVMGGWDPASYDPVRDVFVYDFVTGRWREGTPMPEKRSFFAIGSASGRIYVAGGHDESKNALATGWVYDVRRDEWSPLAPMHQERDECEGFVVGGEDGAGGEQFWVVSGYGTENQGGFRGDAEVYDASTGEWRHVDGVWIPGRCPRGSAGMVRPGGGVVCWGEMVGRVGSCGVVVGDRVMVVGSEYQGGTQGFYLVEGEGQNSKIQKVEVADEFSGFVQSSCCVEI